MNKVLIKKFKKEFDHQLEGGKLQHCYNSKFSWSNSGEGIWSSNPISEITHIVINDEYVEFRKALAEGKTVQVNLGWSTETVNWVEPDLPLTFNAPVECYRIKPDEPKFKPGDWVYTNAKTLHDYVKIKALAIVQEDMSLKPINTDYASVTISIENDTELWEPKPGEWIVLINSLIEASAIICQYYDKMEEQIKPNEYIEPFIGELPTHLK